MEGVSSQTRHLTAAKQSEDRGSAIIASIHSQLLAQGLLCQHGICTLRIGDETATSQSRLSIGLLACELVTEAEQRELSRLYGSDADVFVRFAVDPEADAICRHDCAQFIFILMHIFSSPPLCAECRSEIEGAALVQRMAYEQEYIWIRRVIVDAASQDTTESATDGDGDGFDKALSDVNLFNLSEKLAAQVREFPHI